MLLGLALLTAVLGAADSETAAERSRLLVLDFTASEGVNADITDVASDTYISTLKEIDRFDLATSSDVRMMIGAEQQRQLIGCDDESCMAEIAGALGAEFLSRGRLSLLDEEIILTLELFDSGAASLENQLTEALPADLSQLDDQVRAMTYKLLQVEDPKAWYERKWLWIAAGAVVVGGVVTAIVLTRGDDGDTAPNLGRQIIDG
jgi:hypothetical protein